MTPEPLDLMRRAAFDAVERLNGVSWQFDIETFYPPLGETLTWITALADAMGQIQDPEYSGLAYARNSVIHGVVIVSHTVVQQPGEPSPLKLDVSHWPGVPVTMWGFTDDPEPHDPTSGPEPHAQRRADYNTHVARRQVHQVIDRALLGLGVNIWITGKRGLTPRPAPVRYSIPPGAGPQVGDP
jgi:hypothetical protein